MAYELKQAAELSQRIELTGREKLTVTGVEDVERFDELSVVMRTVAGVLVVSGEDLHIGKLSLDGGELLNDKVDGDPQYLPPGDSVISWTGTVSRLVVTPNWRVL